jgi:hypothetical protein
MKTAHYLSAAIAACALAAGLLALRRPPAAEPEAVVTPPSVPSHPAGPPRLPAPGPGPGPALPIADEPPLKVQVERLLASHKPEDAMRAYSLVADCAEFNGNPDRIIFDSEEIQKWKGDTLPGFRAMTDEEKRHDTRLCGGMSERERLSRLDYLAVAAKAGVRGAAVSFAREGPFGDRSALQTRPDDPLVKEWKATASAQLTEAAESKADLGAIMYLSTEYANGSDLTEKNPLLAYRYFLATNLINEGILGPANPTSKMMAANREQAASAVQEFSPEQRAAEVAAARRIADLNKALREQARKAAPHG